MKMRCYLSKGNDKPPEVLIMFSKDSQICGVKLQIPLTVETEALLTSPWIWHISFFVIPRGLSPNF